jgi:hypothetical protein
MDAVFDMKSSTVIFSTSLLLKQEHYLAEKVQEHRHALPFAPRQKPAR